MEKLIIILDINQTSNKREIYSKERVSTSANLIIQLDTSFLPRPGISGIRFGFG